MTQFASYINVPVPVTPDLSDLESKTREFVAIYASLRNLAEAVDTHTGTIGVTFSETVTCGQGVNLYNVAGLLTARLANATAAGKPVHGFLVDLNGVASGRTGVVALSGLIKNLSGLTPGSTYYASNTPGAFGLAAGTVSQKVGFALSTTVLYLNPDLV